MRSLIAVIDAMKLLTPPDAYDLRHDLDWCREAALYTAPECMGERWKMTAMILCRHFGSKPELFSAWQKAVVDLWMDRVPAAPAPSAAETGVSR